MYDLIIALFKDKPSLVILLVAIFLLPAYMAYRIENAVHDLASRLECGSKIHVSTTSIDSGPVAYIRNKTDASN